MWLLPFFFTQIRNWPGIVGSGSKGGTKPPNPDSDSEPLTGFGFAPFGSQFEPNSGQV